MAERVKAALLHALPSIAYLLVILAPLVTLAVLAVRQISEGQVAWQAVLLPDARRANLFMRSLAYSGAVTVGVTLAGGLIASRLWEIRRAPWCRLRWLFGVMAPVPPYIHALAWGAVLPIAWRAAPGGGILASCLVQSMALLPLGVAVALVGMESVDRDLVAAGCLQRGFIDVWLRIVLPLAAPVISAGAGIVFILTLLDFSVPSLFGLNVYPLEVMVEFSASNEPVRALLYALPLMLLASGVAWLCRPGLTRLVMRSTISVADDTPLLRAPGWLRVLQAAGMGLMALQVVVPLCVLLSRVRSVRLAAETILSSRTEIAHSVIIAGVSALMAVMLAYAPARALVAEGRARGLLWTATVLPLGVPASLVAIGLIVLWNRGLPLDVYGTLWMPVHASLARFLPLAALILAASLARLDRSLLDAAHLVEGSRLRVLARITLPLLLPGVLAATALVLVLTIGELGATLLVVPPGASTLTIKIYNYMHYGASDAVAVLSLFTMLLCVALAGLGIVSLSGRRRDT